jgi:hypothetical protein
MATLFKIKIIVIVSAFALFVGGTVQGLLYNIDLNHSSDNIRSLTECNKEIVERSFFSCLDMSYDLCQKEQTCQRQNGHEGIQDGDTHRDPDDSVVATIGPLGLFQNHYAVSCSMTSLSFHEVSTSHPESITIEGYVLDSKTGQPIRSAEVIIMSMKNEGYTFSRIPCDSHGHYNIVVNTSIQNVTAQIMFRAPRYFTGFLSSIDGEGDTIWKNILLTPVASKETSRIYGRVTDIQTGLPMDNAEILCINRESGIALNLDYNFTVSDKNGLYSINVPPGYCSLIALSSGYSIGGAASLEVDPYQSLKQDISLEHMPPKTALLCGYLHDSQTSRPLESVTIILNWYDNKNHSNAYLLKTNAKGFYTLTLAPGNVLSILFSKSTYFPVHLITYPWDDSWNDTINLVENETTWFNMTMDPLPKETALVQGYLCDASNHKPLYHTEVYLIWEDDDDHSLNKRAFTDFDGYVSFETAPGSLYLIAREDGYLNGETAPVTIEDNQNLQLSLNLTPVSTAKSLLHGFIRDEETGLPIEDASLSISREDTSGNYNQYALVTDSKGFYSILLPPGEITVTSNAENYHSEHIGPFSLDAYTQKELNMTLLYDYNKNAYINGHVTYQETGDSVENAYVTLQWHDTLDHTFSESCFTDANGFYEFIVPAGIATLDVHVDGYHPYSTTPFTVSSDSTITKDIALTPEILSISLVRPQRGLYLHDHKLLPSLWTCVIGDINVEVNVSGTVNYVEFILDGKLKLTDNSPPFVYPWIHDRALRHRHRFTIIAHGMYGGTATETSIIWRFL